MLKTKKQSHSLVGVIIETSEYTWMEAENFLNSRESFLPHLVSYMDKASTQKELVDVLQVFNLADFEVVWDATKGHVGSIDMLFKYVQAGTSLAKAVQTARLFTYDILLAGLEKASNLHDKCKEELNRLKKNNWLLKVEKPLANEALRFLIQKNILFFFTGTLWCLDTLGY